MISKKQIHIESEGLLNLKSLIEVYEEVAATRMQRIRSQVLQSRQFLSGLEEVFEKVKRAYIKENQTGSTLPKNGKAVAVFVSANAGLYGDIVDKTFDLFVDAVKQGNAEVVVLGKLGVKMMADKLPNKLYNYYDFSDDGVDMESFSMIMRYLIQFEKIVVFYGRFKTILAQEPVATSVSGDKSTEVRTTLVSNEKELLYLFEPSVADIVRVFEGEILASIFEQTLHESQLAKFASRMLALDRSIDQVEKKMVKVKMDGVRLGHKIANRKQLSAISGVSLWGGRS